MLKAVLLGAIATSALTAAQAQAQAAAAIDFVGTPRAHFSRTHATTGKSFYTMGVVARFNQELPKTHARVVIGPGIKVGDKLGSVNGGGTPGHIGLTSKHCYVIEVGRPRPISTPRIGARWRVALAMRPKGSTGHAAITHTRLTTLQEFRDGGDFSPAARALGCYGANGKTLVGRRLTVHRKELHVYADPSGSTTGSLQSGQTFTVRRLSKSGNWAYGYAYGKLNRNVWVRTSQLDQN